MPPESARNTRRYNTYTHHASSIIIAEYSTSFSLATRLLPRRMRQDIHNLYAVVRIADEIVDGVAEAAGLSPEKIAAELDAFEQQTLHAITTGFSTNPAVHAFAITARRCRINTDHIRGFFRSMRRDLGPGTYTPEELSTYIWGSAEVIGLMCLSVFTADHDLSPAEQQRCHDGAQSLGAAFQKINFLRDLGEDTTTLNRSYLGPVFDTAERDRIITDITADLDAAYPAIGLLPLSARAGVLATYLIFRDLCRRLASTPVERIRLSRVRVPPHVKAKLATQAALQAPRMGR